MIILLALAVSMLSLSGAVASASHGPKGSLKAPRLKNGPKVVKVKSTKKPPKNVKFRGQPMPGGITIGTSATTDGGGVLVSGVPGYAWRDGCGPTAVGMVVGYYDGNGWPNLIPGDATSDTTEVDQAICSHGTAAQPGSYEDYALPYEITTLMPDKSELPLGDEHASNCLADYMHTSWSYDGLAYGYSSSSMAGPAFSGYVASKYPAASLTTKTYPGTYLTWSLVKQEIDASRPMVFLVDSSGDGRTDHFVTVVGYRETNGYAEYGCWDTWSTTLIRWQQFRAMSSSYAWGVWGGFTFSLSAGQTPPPNPTPTPTDTPTATPTPTLPPVADTTSPVTAASGLDSAWHNTSVTVNFSASDADSGVTYTEYSLDGASWKQGTALTISVSRKTPTAAVHAVQYRSVDKAGNVEAAKLGQVKIDSVKPTTSSNATTQTYKGSFTLTLSPMDADSGVSVTYVSVDGRAYQPATSTLITGTGRHTVKFYSDDNAGNVEGAKTVTVRIGQ
jgi:hypothetical protein